MLGEIGECVNCMDVLVLYYACIFCGLLMMLSDLNVVKSMESNYVIMFHLIIFNYEL
jgi:hypothetical protein